MDDVFTSTKDGVIGGEKCWIVCVWWVCSGHWRVSRTSRKVLHEASWGCEVNKAGLVASSYVPYPPFVSLHVSVNSGIASEGTTYTMAHDPHLNHDLLILVIDHLGAT